MAWLSSVDTVKSMDPLKVSSEESLSFVSENYFRTELYNFEIIEGLDFDRPVIFYGNHSGNSMPWDAMMSLIHLRKKTNDSGKTLKTVFDKSFFGNPFMNLFCQKDFKKDLLSCYASFDHLEQAIKNKEALLYYPEGVDGIGKGYSKRYQLQNFATSFVRLAIKYNAILVPVYTINAEYIHPFCMVSKRLNSITERIGIPIMPIGLGTMLLPVFPFLFWSAFPAKLKIVLGEPREISGKICDKIIREKTEELKFDFQAKLNQLVLIKGNSPIELRNFMGHLFKNTKKAFKILPLGWPFLFKEKKRWLPLFYLPFLGLPLLFLKYNIRPKHWRKPELADEKSSWELEDFDFTSADVVSEMLKDAKIGDPRIKYEGLAPKEKVP